MIRAEIRGGGLTMVDGFSAEIETLELIAAFIRRLQPEVVVECGGFRGVGAVYMAKALKSNGHGKLYCIEKEKIGVDVIKSQIKKHNLMLWCDVVHGESQRVDIPGPYGFVFHDG